MRKASARPATFAAAAIALLAVVGAQGQNPLSPTAPLDADARRWVEETLASLDLEGMAGQMIFLRASGLPVHPASEEFLLLREVADSLKVGGIVLFRSEVGSVPPLLRALQEGPSIPLLVAADLERSLSFRVDHGSVSLPYAMALGATGSTEASRFAGEVTAREGRALGVHWALAPVADVNNNPDNPVIGVRSFGEDPAVVARHVAAYVEGLQAGGMLASVKHFPGHGDTDVDSHYALPVLGADRQRLEAVELPPFRAAVEAGAASVMMAHVAVPALDPSGAPASLSKALAEDLLRGEMGYQGLIVTDSMGMAGVGGVWSGAAAVRAVQAGADALLLPPDPKVALQSLLRAVEEGQLTAERIEASARRILEAKARLGLHRGEGLPTDIRLVGRPQDEARAREIAEASITVVKNQRKESPEEASQDEKNPGERSPGRENLNEGNLNEGNLNEGNLNEGSQDEGSPGGGVPNDGVRGLAGNGGILPLRAEEPLRLLHLTLSQDRRSRLERRIPEREIARRRIPTDFRRLWGEVSPQQADAVSEAAAGATHVVVSLFGWGASSVVPRSQAQLLQRLADEGHRLVVVSFAGPYALRSFPEVPAYLCAYGAAESSQRAAIAALFGEIDVRGKLPVTLPVGPESSFPRGHGIEMDRHPMSLTLKPPEEAGFRPGDLEEVDRVIEGFLEQKAFPGAVVAVGKGDALVHLSAHGRLTYDEGAAEVETDTIYDLASLTKVIATTTMAMILVDEGKLDLDAKVQDFLPLFQGEGKEKVTVRHLLTHSSGADWWAPLYQELKGQDAYVERIQAMDLVYEPGTKSLYSDLGLILLGEILERVAGQSLDSFVQRRIFEPLGMNETGYRPEKDLLGRIAPTEEDPEWRGRLIHGEVHDENAFALGGVAPHAGLFGTAPDLARFARMILNGGVFEHHRLVSRKTVELFTRRAGVPDSTRALGWDTKSEEGSSAGTLFSASSFGHTGFTGTSLWIDPERDLFVILLTNRVHPTRENNLIRQVRPAVADAVVQALAEP